MAKVRVFVFLLTLLIVGAFGIYISYYARGYRLNLRTLRFQPNGILVIKSEPDGASVYVNGELKTATNANVSMSPGTYDVEVKKDGFFPWYKRLSIQKEVVTSVSISLFKNVPSLAPVTFSGAENPISSEDGTKIAFIVPSTGLWVMDAFTLPLGFSTDPKRITDGDLTGATYSFSPDGRQLILNTSNGIFLLDSGSFTAQAQRVNITSKKSVTLASWQREKEIKNASLIKNLPPELNDILLRKSSDFTLSPDAQMILFTASSSAELPDNLIRPLPGSSTQRQERSIQPNHTYIYDIKEDRNFLIANQPSVLRFMPDSRHILSALDNQAVIMDYDGTNRQVVYSGSYDAPFVFPYINATKLLILTNLGAASSTPNLYTLTVK